MHLIDVGHVDHGEQGVDVDVGAGFLEGFAGGRVRRRFADFHEAGGQRPVAEARFDGAPAQQYPALPFSDAADDDFRVAVMDFAAVGADVTRQVVARRDAVFEAGAAVGAEVHGGIVRRRLRFYTTPCAVAAAIRKGRARRVFSARFPRFSFSWRGPSRYNTDE